MQQLHVQASMNLVPPCFVLGANAPQTLFHKFTSYLPLEAFVLVVLAFISSLICL